MSTAKTAQKYPNRFGPVLKGVVRKAKGEALSSGMKSTPKANMVEKSSAVVLITYEHQYGQTVSDSLSHPPLISALSASPLLRQTPSFLPPSPFSPHPSSPLLHHVSSTRLLLPPFLVPH